MSSSSPTVATTYVPLTPVTSGVLVSTTTAVLSEPISQETVQHTPRPLSHKTSSETASDTFTSVKISSSSPTEVIGPSSIPGYDLVQQLAAFLLTLKDCNHFMTTEQEQELIRLWTNLHDHDKQPTKFPPIFKRKYTGRFRAKKETVPGVVATERGQRAPDSVPAASPDCNRYVEALFRRLTAVYPGSQTVGGQKSSRWTLIMTAYSVIRSTVYSSTSVMSSSRLQLPEVNQKTLRSWYNDTARTASRNVLYQGLRLPEASFTAAAPVLPPVPMSLSNQPAPLGAGSFRFNIPSQTPPATKMKKQVFKKRKRASTPPTTTVAASPILATTPLPTTSGHTFAPQLIVIQPVRPQVQPAAPCPTPPPPPQPCVSDIPYTTMRYREKKRKLEEQGITRRGYKRTKQHNTCSKCGGLIVKPSHINYWGNVYCSNTESVSLETWKEQFKNKNYGKKKKNN